MNFTKFVSQINELSPQDSALVTHYLHNYDPISSSSFLLKEKAKNILEYFKSNDIQQHIPFPPVKNHSFTFIDLFAGIGGFRLAMQNLGGKSVFSCEWDKYSQQTYFHNFGEYPFGDINKIDVENIPSHDILCAGFPCQAFSIAGKRAGFEDTRGTLFFNVASIIKEKRPKAFFLENVKGLMNHKSGQTLRAILKILQEDLDYYVPEPQIVNAKDFGVPQNRERIFIVGFRKDVGVNEFSYPEPLDTKTSIAEIKEENPVSVKYYLSTQYLKSLEAHKQRHMSKGNGFGFEIKSDQDIANAIVVGGMGRERNLIIDNRLKDYTPVTNIKGQVNREGVRRMTPREWARLQGFPDKFKIVVSDAQAYKQLGNSVAIPAIQAMANKMIEKLGEKNDNWEQRGMERSIRAV